MNEPGHDAPSKSIAELRIALVSTGLSHIRRGFETFISDLYESLRDTGTVHLFKGSGHSSPPDVYSVPCLPRHHPVLTRLFPENEARRYRAEQVTMALGGWKQGYWKRYDIIHFCDPAFGGMLLRLRKQFKYNYQLLFANCGPTDPKDYRRFDHIQEFTPEYLNRARGTIRKTLLHLNPMGIWAERFDLETERGRLREKWRIPQERFVILCVAALDEPYKRIPFLIDTVAALNDNSIHLLLVGDNRQSPHAKETLALAEAKLPGRYRHLTVPYAEIAEIYKASDLFVLPSLQEGFGKVYLEAMASRMPLLCHNHPNTQWIVKSPQSLVDMTQMDALKAAIAAVRNEAGNGLSEMGRAMADVNYGWVRERFHWNALRPEYMGMYERIILLPT